MSGEISYAVGYQTHDNYRPQVFLSIVGQRCWSRRHFMDYGVSYQKICFSWSQTRGHDFKINLRLYLHWTHGRRKWLAFGQRQLWVSTGTEIRIKYNFRRKLYFIRISVCFWITICSCWDIINLSPKWECSIQTSNF